jgi:hypothetical protein
MVILDILTYRIPPSNYYDPKFKFWTKKWGGHSYLLNPEALFIQRRFFSDREIAEYAGVASFRSYNHYVTTKDTTLDLIRYPLSEDIIKNNRLLEIKGDKIHFKFEEIRDLKELKWQ